MKILLQIKFKCRYSLPEHVKTDQVFYGEYLNSGLGPEGLMYVWYIEKNTRRVYSVSLQNYEITAIEEYPEEK